jgi:hypothetical protein
MDDMENELSGFVESDCQVNVIQNGGHWIDLKEEVCNYSSYDGSHLDDESAIMLSGDLAREIKR